MLGSCVPQRSLVPEPEVEQSDAIGRLGWRLSHIVSRRNAVLLDHERFLLIGAIACGIIKLPRVPTADNLPGDEM